MPPLPMGVATRGLYSSDPLWHLGETMGSMANLLNMKYIYARATWLYKKMEDSENRFITFLIQCGKNNSRSLMSRNTEKIKARWERKEYDEAQANILLLY